jgi:hypothetical protein
VEDLGLEFDDHGYDFDWLQLVEDPGLEFDDHGYGFDRLQFGYRK